MSSTRKICAGVAALVLMSSAATLAHSASRLLLAVSDTDMVSTGYHDGHLGPALGQPDTLSIFDLQTGKSAALGSLPASNAMNSPANTLAVTPDGRLVLVAETWGPRPEGSLKVSDLPPGNRLRAYDIRDPANPRLVGDRQVMSNPSGIAVSPSGDMVVVTGGPHSNGLVFLSLADGKLGEPQSVALDLAERPDLSGDPAHQVRWHPSGDVLAVTLPLRSQIAFFRIGRQGDRITGLTPWGTVQANKFPHVAEFTPDGRFLMTSDVQWGLDVPNLYDTLSQGVLTTVRLAPLDDSGARPAHIVVGATHGGHQAEFLSISPDGKLLAIASIHTTSRPGDDPLFDPHASISLYRIDTESGRLSHSDTQRFVATNPQGLAFDASGDRLYLGVGESRRGCGPQGRGRSLECGRGRHAGADGTAVSRTARRAHDRRRRLIAKKPTRSAAEAVASVTETT
ncbi:MULTISPECIES: lactonase family protein [Agrobacterium]|uniref:lactonase family protein n=1 Tax=Agrobacterium tumefaciens TaxID=358 RepID=UPI000EF1B7D2|nr:hypothetical protein At1D1108_50710 [Agrobacterium tumefaciens]NSY09815.1 lactonase family protein [Agrobacterium tumefaciens]NSY93328.1 lactonase family protein [Agrobacterium tumefaciens]